MDRFAGAEIEYVVNEVMSRKISESILQASDGEDLKPTTVTAADFNPIIKDQKDSIMNQKDEKKQQPSIRNIRKLHEDYKFPSASSSKDK